MEGTDLARRSPCFSSLPCSDLERCWSTLMTASFSRSSAWSARILDTAQNTPSFYKPWEANSITCVGRCLPVLHPLMSMTRQRQVFIKTAVGWMARRMIDDGRVPARKAVRVLFKKKRKKHMPTSSSISLSYSAVLSMFHRSFTSELQRWQLRPLRTASWCSPPGTFAPTWWCLPPGPESAPPSP